MGAVGVARGAARVALLTRAAQLFGRVGAARRVTFLHTAARRRRQRPRQRRRIRLASFVGVFVARVSSTPKHTHTHTYTSIKCICLSKHFGEYEPVGAVRASHAVGGALLARAWRRLTARHARHTLHARRFNGGRARQHRRAVGIKRVDEAERGGRRV